MSPAVQPHQRSEKLRIFSAVPEGSRRARSQPAALRALEHHIAEQADLGRLRADAERNALTVARALIFTAHWRTMTLRPGWDTLTDRTGLSRSTIQRVIRRLRDWGFLGIISTGSTWRTRGCRQDDRDGDLAAEYILCVPAQKPVEITDSPSLLRQEERSKPHASARETAQEVTDRPWPMHQPPQTRGQRLTATQRLQQQAPVLARLGDRHLRSILRPWYQRGWTPAQVLYALDHTPDGVLRWHTADVRHVPGWIRSRLAAWDGRTPPRQLGAGRTTDLTPEQVTSLRNVPRLPDHEARTHVSLARRLLAATKRRSDEKPPRGLGVLLPGRDGETTTRVVEEPAVVERVDAGGDWLLRAAAGRADPDLMLAFGGLGVSA